MIAHFAGGARNVARIKVASYLLRLCALLCSPFSAVKMGGPFSLRCLSPLCSPTVGVGQTQPMRIGMFWRGLGGFAAQNSRLGFCSTVGINNHAQTTQLGCFDAVWIFSQHKRPAGNQIHAGLCCEPEGLSPDGGLSYPTSTKPHQTGEPWHLSCHGGKIPAKPHVLRMLPRPMGAVWGAGGHPLRR